MLIVQDLSGNPGLQKGLWEQLRVCSRVHPLPALQQKTFLPATHYLYEWENYWLDLPGVEYLRVGQSYVGPVVGTWYNLRFENQVGLASVQPYAAGKALSSQLWLLVCSRKFPTPEAHSAFFHNLLEDLFERALQLPFVVSSTTAQNVTETLRPPTPLFTLHFLCQYGPRLSAALNTIQAFPHRLLTDTILQVPIAEVAYVDDNTLTDILHNPDRWQRTQAQVLVANQMQGYAPSMVEQRCAEESFDNPENRFVKHFLHQILLAAEQLPMQSWWSRVSRERQQLVRQVSTIVRQVLAHPMFVEVGQMHQLPFSSQVLLRSAGYRDLLDLWQRFQQARRPLFAALQQAIEVRDIATLYEIWTYFALVDKIAKGLQLKAPPVIELEFTTEQGLVEGAVANFGNGRTLVYNRKFRRPLSYSVPLRPDFTLMWGKQPEVVFDAKFRLEQLPHDGEESSPVATAERTDLYKMHTYRDALGVRAAVVLYPGTETLFYHCDSRKCESLSLVEIVTQPVSGIGALPLSPKIAGETPAQVG
ncbi:MAG: DUF2357 domain-containing protein [Anaerolineae bacterium]|nr:DUF2357 domain-containing protein [Anaerolineae bacterium]